MSPQSPLPSKPRKPDVRPRPEAGSSLGWQPVDLSRESVARIVAHELGGTA